MISTNGWAIEPVPPGADRQPPTPAYAYTIGVTDLTGFPEIAVFGLTPAAANGLITLVVDALRGGTEIPLDVELVGLLDNDLRCRLAVVPPTQHHWFATAAQWYTGREWSVAQLLYPDRNGFLPYEAGFAPRLQLAQPVLGEVT